MRNRLIAAAILILLLIGGIWGTIAYATSFQQVRVEADTEASITIYAGTYEGDGHTPAELGKNLRTVTNGDTFKLKKGAYTAVLDDPKKEFATTIYSLNLNDQPETLRIHPNYTAQKLKTLLASQESSIRQVLEHKYPQIGISFTIASGSLYQRGDWYGALLKPHSPKQDIYRVILEKRDGRWQIVTDPPEIIISKIKYPSIPVDVISDVDNFKR